MELSARQVISMFAVLAILTSNTGASSTFINTNKRHPLLVLSALKRGVNADPEQVSAEQDYYRRRLENSVSEKWVGEGEDRITDVGTLPFSISQEADGVPVCHEMPIWAWNLIRNISDTNLEDTYYHLPRETFVLSSVHRLRCHHRCPVHLRLVNPKSRRLWPKHLVEAECACKEDEETSCSGPGLYQCQQRYAKVLVVPLVLPGEIPRYCLQLVKAGCLCERVHFTSATMADLFIR